ncbi:hypothetical protein [Salinibacter altiplanensis]|uniref:hypothetical protein n=1 Tax=Salinibacter altiplanensis TaxID=1803181 RepID=UPI000C9EF4AF|nr:hypothetical protein [Salinibacter altiplanensis]
MNHPVSPDAYGDLVAGIEEKTRGGGQHHVAEFYPSGGLGTSRENAFTDRDALNEWIDSLPDGDTAVVVKFETDSPPPDHERTAQSDNSREDNSREDNSREDNSRDDSSRDDSSRDDSSRDDSTQSDSAQ